MIKKFLCLVPFVVLLVLTPKCNAQCLSPKAAESFGKYFLSELEKSGTFTVSDSTLQKYTEVWMSERGEEHVSSPCIANPPHFLRYVLDVHELIMRAKNATYNGIMALAVSENMHIVVGYYTFGLSCYDAAESVRKAIVNVYLDY